MILSASHLSPSIIKKAGIFAAIIFSFAHPSIAQLSDFTDVLNRRLQESKKDGEKNIVIPAGTYFITAGFVVPDGVIVSGSGMDKTVLKLQQNLPPRRNEKTQTAVFTGEKAYSLNRSASTKNISIRNLTIDLSAASPDSANSQLPMLGGIRFINPVGCLVDSVRIIRPPRFGIGFFSTQKGRSCSSNRISNCKIEMDPDWYEIKTDSFIRPRQKSLIGIELSSFHGPDNNGAGKYLSRNNPLYFPSRTSRNIVSKNSISGGSHGISLSNACSNTIAENNIFGSSHRGIIIISTSDNNTISENNIFNIGSTGIHLAYGCESNLIAGNSIDSVFGMEGDGIKSYINCNLNRFMNNRVSHFSRYGIRVAHGANENEISDNSIKGDGRAGQTGVAIIARLGKDFGHIFPFDDELRSDKNLCRDNEISNTEYGIAGGGGPGSIIEGNRFVGVKQPFP